MWRLENICGYRILVPPRVTSPRPWSLIHDVASWIPRRAIQWRRGLFQWLSLGSHCFCWLTLLLLSWTQSTVGRWNKYTQWSHYKVCLLESFSKYCTTPLSIVHKILFVSCFENFFFISLITHPSFYFIFYFFHHFRYNNYDKSS